MLAMRVPFRQVGPADQPALSAGNDGTRPSCPGEPLGLGGGALHELMDPRRLRPLHLTSAVIAC